VYFTPKLTGFPWNWVSALGVKKNWNDVATWSKKKFDDIINHLDTTYERDGQRNGQTPADSNDRANA